jgi:hypothetical protein
MYYIPCIQHGYGGLSWASGLNGVTVSNADSRTACIVSGLTVGYQTRVTNKYTDQVRMHNVSVVEGIARKGGGADPEALYNVCLLLKTFAIKS